MARKSTGGTVVDWLIPPHTLKLNKDTHLLKLIAMLAMLIDHLGAVVFPQYRSMRIIGRLAFPLYAYCLVAGCIYTKDILRYIDDHIYKKITLPDIMAHTRRSQSALVHSFKKSMGISIKQYILQKKMALAHQKIREGIPMSTVALQFGYDNYSVFYRAYRNYLRNNGSEINNES